jgi:SAM-dependent methyltransferase
MWNSACPGCDARSRHRGLALLIPHVLRERPDLRRVLHFAPEGVLARIFLSVDGLDYRTTDLTEPHCDFPGEDIQHLSFGDGDYDLVLCNQVLEHIPDDGAGMRELCRILSPRGLALITVPCDWRQAETEMFTHVRPGGHYRHYGRDLAERLRQVFQSVEVFDMHRLDAAPNGLSYGIPEYDMVFVCGKGGPVGLPDMSENRSWAKDVGAKD